MEFFIRKGATLPLLKLNIVNNGRNDYDRFLDTFDLSAVFFSMTDTDTGIPKLVNRPAGFGTHSSSSADSRYYIYYQFSENDTKKVGRYESEFIVRNSDGTGVFPTNEKLFINVVESFISDDIDYSSCYIVDFACCYNKQPIPIIYPTPTPTPSATLPELQLSLGAIYSPGSISIDFVIESNKVFQSDVTFTFDNVIVLKTGQLILISTGVTLSQGSVFGSTNVIIDEDINNLDFAGFRNVESDIGWVPNFKFDNFFIYPTPTPTQTPTQTLPNQITCNENINYNNGGSGQFYYNVELGTDVGDVTLNYNAFSIPDRFIVYWDGEEVINTGFRGDSSYDSELNSLGYPNVSGPGNGSESFTKTSSTPSNVIVYILAPLSGTAWDFTVNCPVAVTSTTPTPTITLSQTPFI